MFLQKGPQQIHINNSPYKKKITWTNVLCRGWVHFSQLPRLCFRKTWKRTEQHLWAITISINVTVKLCHCHIILCTRRKSCFTFCSFFDSWKSVYVGGVYRLFNNIFVCAFCQLCKVGVMIIFYECDIIYRRCLF